MTTPVSVVLIREYAEQLTGSGCCGKLADDTMILGREDPYAYLRRQQQDLGVLHRAIREFFPPAGGQVQVAVVTVDPRNQLYLIAKLCGDVWRYRPGWRSGLRVALQMFSLPAVVVNGRVISRRNRPLDPDSLCHEIHQLLRHGL